MKIKILTLLFVITANLAAQEIIEVPTPYTPYTDPGINNDQPPPPANSPDGLTQTSASNGAYNPQVPSPETTMANTLKDIPVNLHTGTPQINIPLYTFTEGNISIPLSLSYNASGIRGNQVATWAGLGWSLEGIPSLTRVVRGLPDDGSYYGKGYYLYGNTTSSSSSINDDLESDIYYFNTGTQVFKFMFDRQKRPRFFPDSDIKVKVTYDTGPYFGYRQPFDNFIFILPNGLTYEFDVSAALGRKAEITVALEVGEGNVQNANSTQAYHERRILSDWKIKKISSPYGHEVNFESSNVGYSFYRLAENQYNGFCGVDSKKIERVFVETSRINSITGKNVKVSILGNGRDDLDGFSNASPQNSNIGAPKLSVIEVISNNNTFAPLNFTFDYDYFIGNQYSDGGLPSGYSTSNTGITHRKRLKLKKITLPDGNFYGFDYIGESYNYKSRLTYGVDHWGYLNGYDNNINKLGFIGNDNLSGSCSTYSLRETSLAFMQYGSIQKNTSSLGTETEFIFEANRAANYNNGNTDVGGLRIKEIKTKDNIRNTNTSKTYEYNLSNGWASSGFMPMKPIYRFSYSQYSPFYCNSSLYGILLNEMGKAPIGYSRVIEKFKNNNTNTYLGYTINEFNNDTTEENYSLSNFPYTGTAYLPERYVPDHDFISGTPKKVEVYNQNNQKLSEATYTYTPINGIITGNNSWSKKAYRLNGSSYAFEYYQTFKKYRLESTTTKTYGLNGGGTPITQTVNYTYKDQMPATFKTKYKGEHNNVVKTTTTDSYGYTVESQSLIAADFSFANSYYWECNPELCEELGRTCPNHACNEEVVVNHVPNPGTEGRPIYELQKINNLYAPIEIISKRNNKIISANYQNYYETALPKESYSIKTIPKTSITALTVNNYSVIKDTDYGAYRSKVETYNTHGFPTRIKSNYGATSTIGYDGNQVLPVTQTSNFGIADALSSSSQYDKYFLGPSKTIAPNATEKRYEYEIKGGLNTGRLKTIRNQNNEIIQTTDHNY